MGCGHKANLDLKDKKVFWISYIVFLKNRFEGRSSSSTKCSQQVLC